MDIMAPGQEIGCQGGIMKKSLENYSLVAGLSHIPHATSTTARAGVLVGVVLDVQLGSRVVNPFAFTFYLGQ